MRAINLLRLPLPCYWEALKCEGSRRVCASRQRSTFRLNTDERSPSVLSLAGRSCPRIETGMPCHYPVRPRTGYLAPYETAWKHTNQRLNQCSFDKRLVAVAHRIHPTALSVFVGDIH